MNSNYIEIFVGDLDHERRYFENNRTNFESQTFTKITNEILGLFQDLEASSKICFAYLQSISEFDIANKYTVLLSALNEAQAAYNVQNDAFESIHKEFTNDSSVMTTSIEQSNLFLTASFFISRRRSLLSSLYFPILLTLLFVQLMDQVTIPFLEKRNLDNIVNGAEEILATSGKEALTAINPFLGGLVTIAETANRVKHIDKRDSADYYAKFLEEYFEFLGLVVNEFNRIARSLEGIPVSDLNDIIDQIGLEEIGEFKKFVAEKLAPEIMREQLQITHDYWKLHTT